MPPRKYLFIPLSSPGYIFPAIRLAHILERAGDHVFFATATEHAQLIETQGLQCLGIRNDGIPFLHSASWFAPQNARPEVTVLDTVVRQFQPDYIVSNPLVLSAFVLAERFGIPLLNVGFAEYLYPLVTVAAGSPPAQEGGGKDWRLSTITDFYNNYRGALGMGFIAKDPLHSPLIGSRYFIRSTPELYSGDGLPPQVSFIGDLYWEPPYENIRLRRFIAEAKQAGRPVVYVQLGRMFEHGHVWSALIGLFSRTDMAFVIDTGRADYLAANAAPPANCFFHTFIPLGAIAEDVDLVLSSGQSTTCVAALLHGKHLLCLPHSADSAEHTQRLVSQGLALGLHGPDQLNLDMVLGAMRHLLSEPNSEAIAQKQQALRAWDDQRILRAFRGEA